MTKIKTLRGYRRNGDGTLSIVDVHDFGHGLETGVTYLTPTDELDTLMGWPDEGTARVYLTDGGVEVLIPESE